MVKYITPLIIFLINLSWGQNCTADDGTPGVEFNFFNDESGECYSIENTTVINKNNCNTESKTGSIPPEIGLLTNLIITFFCCGYLEQTTTYYTNYYQNTSYLGITTHYFA